MATGSLRAYPNIGFNFCHGGGAFTPLRGHPLGRQLVARRCKRPGGKG